MSILERYCLDTYAILAFIGGEPGAEVVERAFTEALKEGLRSI
ncbi:MAG: hypothetical protein QXK52_06730 [Candidatus Bathyarchaeia archaeon]